MGASKRRELCLTREEVLSNTLSMKYRKIKTPPVKSDIHLRDVKRLANCLKSQNVTTGKVTIRFFRTNKDSRIGDIMKIGTKKDSKFIDFKVTKAGNLKFTPLAKTKNSAKWKTASKGKIVKSKSTESRLIA